MAGLDDLGPFVRGIVRHEFARRQTMATVQAVVGTQVTVRRLGYGVDEGRYLTHAGGEGRALRRCRDYQPGHPRSAAQPAVVAIAVSCRLASVWGTSQ